VKRVIIILILHLTVFSLSANAGDIYLSGNIGVGTANENIESISSISGYVEYNFLDNMAVRASVNHYGGESKIKDLYEGEFEMLSFATSVIAKIDQNTGVTPYLGLGLGYYLPEIKLSSTIDIVAEVEDAEKKQEIDNAIGFHVITGVILSITENAEFEFCAKYIIIKPGVKTTINPIESGASYSLTGDSRLDTLALNCGLRFKF